MEDDDDILLRHIDEEHGFAQAELLGCDRSPDWEVRASSAPSVAGRRTDFRFALAAIASSPVCSLAKKLEGVEVLLSDEYRKISRRKMARFVSGLRDQVKRAIRTWVELVHRLRPVTMPPPLIKSQKHTSDESLMDWLEEHMTLDPAAVSKQRWLYLPRSLLENGQAYKLGNRLELKGAAADLAIKWLEWLRERKFDLRHAGAGRGLGMYALRDIDRTKIKKPLAAGEMCSRLLA